MPDAVEAAGQHVQQEAPDELMRVERHGLVKRWLRNFGQDDEWNFCLTTGTLVPANQERP